MFSAQVHYSDKKGAGCMRVFGDEAKLLKFVSTLRREAVIKNNYGQQIGEVYALGLDVDASHPNRKWGWYYDADAAQWPADEGGRNDLREH